MIIFREVFFQINYSELKKKNIKKVNIVVGKSDSKGIF